MMKYFFKSSLNYKEYLAKSNITIGNIVAFSLGYFAINIVIGKFLDDTFNNLFLVGLFLLGILLVILFCYLILIYKIVFSTIYKYIIVDLENEVKIKETDLTSILISSRFIASLVASLFLFFINLPLLHALSIVAISFYSLVVSSLVLGMIVFASTPYKILDGNYSVRQLEKDIERIKNKEEVKIKKKVNKKKVNMKPIKLINDITVDSNIKNLNTTKFVLREFSYSYKELDDTIDLLSKIKDVTLFSMQLNNCLTSIVEILNMQIQFGKIDKESKEVLNEFIELMDTANKDTLKSYTNNKIGYLKDFSESLKK